MAGSGTVLTMGVFKHEAFGGTGVTDGPAHIAHEFGL